MEKEYVVEANSQFAAQMQEIELSPYEEEIIMGNNEVTQDCFIYDAKVGENGPYRKVVRADIVDNEDRSSRRVRFTLAVQRRHKLKEEWQDVCNFKASELKGSEQARIHLSAAETYELFQILQDLYAISRGGEPSGQKKAYVVRHGDAPSPISVTEIRKFLATCGENVWQEIVGMGQQIPLALAVHKVHEARKQAVEEFEAHLTANDWDEGDWQTFFDTHTWIFGHGLSYRFLSIKQSQAHYGGGTVTGRGTQKGDYLMATKANVKFTVLVEIKRSDTHLMKPAQYRNGAFAVSDELAGGVAQVQANCRTWGIEGSRQDANRDHYEGEDIFTYEPKGILIIGNTDELKAERNKRTSFELYRRNLHNPEVLTFDELLERARYMVDHNRVAQEVADMTNA